MRRSLFCSAALVLMLAAGVPALTSAAGGPCSRKTPQYCPLPNVKTGPAKDVTTTSATLTGTVNPNGTDTTCHFEYGGTTAYGSSTSPQNVGSGTKRVQVTADVTGLTPGTTYHFQLVCKNLGGQAGGGDSKFKTHGRPAARTGTGKSPTAQSLTLQGTVNPSGLPTRCWFRYGRTESYGFRTPVLHVGSGTRAKTVTARVTGLKPMTVYHFRLFCANAQGSAQGRDRQVETRHKA